LSDLPPQPEPDDDDATEWPDPSDEPDTEPSHPAAGDGP
jgi:hypothetical protein